jgi:phosphomethylpyrimidine synthase
MKITEDVRRYAEEMGMENPTQALEEGLQEKSKEFKARGGRLY